MEGRTRVRLVKTRYPPKQGGQQLPPAPVALAAPTTPQSKTMMNSASSKILATAPTPVTHMPKIGLPDTRTKSQKSWLNPWNRHPNATMR